MKAHFRLAADIGGTFTDLVLSSTQGYFATKKVLSTSPDYWQAVIAGFLDLLNDHHFNPSDVVEIRHATTVATNTVLQRSGPRCGLITTRGFRDVLELRRMRFPETYNLFWSKPPPLIDRHLRVEIDERVDAHGYVLRPLSESEVLEAARRLVIEDGVASIAVALINSPVNPAHEQSIGDLISKHFPDVFVSLSSEVLPELREYERTSTTVLNAYLRPSVSVYLQRMASELKSRGLSAPVYVMQSGGGMMSMDTAIRFPVHILESGPAAGIVGAVHVAGEIDARDVVTFDMGGTTAKAAVIENGIPFKAAEFEIGAPISIASRVLKGGGYLVRVPAIDVAEVGAGGGSIASIDDGGVLAVGPRSAGASPGPACYQLGGSEPTVTDANLLLGFVNERGLVGGGMPLSLAKADIAMRVLADRLGESTIGAADGVRRVAINTMARAVRAVSIERGRDVRKAMLVAFGGNGPLHAAHLAQVLGIRRVLVPKAAGVFSALGLLFSDSERTFLRPFHCDLDALDLRAVENAFAGIVRNARATLNAERPDAKARIDCFADIRYKGQTFELRVPTTGSDRQLIDAIKTAFESAYLKTYGHIHPESRIQIVNIGCVARALMPHPSLEVVRSSADSSDIVHRDVLFSDQGGLVTTSVIRDRERLRGTAMPGPLLIEEYDTTSVVPPGWRASLTHEGNILIEHGDAG